MGHLSDRPGPTAKNYNLVSVPAWELDALSADPSLALTEQTAQALNSAVYSKVRDTEKAFYELGDMLYLAWHGTIWKALGLDSWEQWLAGVRLTKGAASDMIRIKELRLAFPDSEPRILDTNPSNLRLLLPHLQQDRETREWCVTEEDLEEGLEKAQTRSWRQLRDELNNDLDPLEPRAAETPANEIRTVEIACKSCGAIHKYEVA